MQQPQQNIKPQYQVERLEGTVQRVITGIENGTFVQRTIDEPAGFMVYLPSGGSIRARSEAHLRELGIDPESTPGLIDMETGEEVAAPSMSLKQQVQSRTKRGKRNASSKAASSDDDD